MNKVATTARAIGATARGSFGPDLGSYRWIGELGDGVPCGSCLSCEVGGVAGMEGVKREGAGHGRSWLIEMAWVACDVRVTELDSLSLSLSLLLGVVESVGLLLLRHFQKATV